MEKLSSWKIQKMILTWKHSFYDCIFKYNPIYLIGINQQIELDRGEKQTIALALKNKADKVIIDEKLGRTIADYYGLNITGTLGVLSKAKSIGLIDSFYELAIEMKNQGIHYNLELINKIAQKLGEK